MTKIVLTSDWHVDAVTAGVERYNELRAHVAALVAYCDRNEVDHVIFGGDAFDPGSMSESRWSSFILESAFKIQNAVKGSSLWIAGNHDVVERSDGVTTLSPLRVACDEINSRAASITDRLRAIHVAETPAHYVLNHPEVAKSVRVLALPFVARAAVKPDTYSSVFWQDELPPDVVVGHLTVPGIVPGSEEEMLRGRDIVFPHLEVAALKPKAVFNGHYHRPQTINVEGLDIQIIGAPARMTFGEVDATARGFLVLEL
jgi:DNA repair exonuclease SbcCD nuclease subunit